MLSKVKYYVGMGASAGGLESVDKFFKNIPSDTGMTFILILHLEANHFSLMPKLIQNCSEMKVIEVTDGMVTMPDTIYIIPPKFQLSIKNGRFHLTYLLETSTPFMSINVFFRCLADDQGDKSIAIIFSGMGTDGSEGMKAIKEKSGLCIVQEPDSAKYDDMPKSAIKTNIIDYILLPEKMPAQLLFYIKSRDTLLSKKHKLSLKYSSAIDKILVLLKTKTGHDFLLYKKNTIHRRVERRMNIHQIVDISAYVQYLHENSAEVEILFKELLIGVTNFFRDPEAFDILKEKILIKNISSKHDDYIFRVWVPGCSNGEEAYSIAILLKECMERLNHFIGIQIFATDIDEQAINRARMGIYSKSITSDISSERLKRFFVTEGNMFRIRKDIREMLVFATQDIIKDPPFTNIDLICCRNLLIYFKSELQRKLLPIFHYGLRPQGILFLGASETIGGFSDLFSPINKKWKIFKHKALHTNRNFSIEIPLQRSHKKFNSVIKEKDSDSSITELSQNALLEQYVPPSAIINSKGEILYVHGRTGKYLEPAVGEARMNIYEMVREGLRVKLSTMVQEAGDSKGRIGFKGWSVNIHVIPIIKKALGYPELFIVTFEEVGFSDKEKIEWMKDNHTKKVDDKVDALGKELEHTRESLQATIEELETSNEELKSTNEEFQSTNEELQSANEELETSKEEQQSLNEELSTVNSELHNKIDELTIINNDMKNLFDSIEIPTIILDKNLLIKRFTTHASSIISLIPSDINRPISDIAVKLVGVDLEEISSEVIKNLVFKEQEVVSKDNQVYLMRVLPYRSIDNVNDGVVITFQNIIRNKNIHEDFVNCDERLRIMVDSLHKNIILSQMDRELRYVWVYNPYPDFNPKEILGKRDDEIGKDEGTIKLFKLKLRVLERGIGEKEEISLMVSGNPRLHEVYVQPIYGIKGKIRGLTSFSINVTDDEKKRAPFSSCVGALDL